MYAGKARSGWQMALQSGASGKASLASRLHLVQGGGRPLSTWEQTVSKALRALGLESIRNKLLAFAVLATVIPAWSTAWISYAHNKRSLTEKITGEQLSASSQTARELDLWLKERLYDLRVFASSYEVTENLERLPKAGGALARDGQPHRRLNDFLTSVRERFVDYEALIVVDDQGRAVATGATAARAVPLPPDWRAGFAYHSTTHFILRWHKSWMPG